MMNSGLRRLLSGAVALMLLGCSSALADTATVTARKLILREKASSTSDALQTLPKGTKLEVLGKSGSWYKVTYGKYTGYVYKTYVSVTKTAAAPVLPAARRGWKRGARAATSRICRQS
mgnify:CR=1 FL=1